MLVESQVFICMYVCMFRSCDGGLVLTARSLCVVIVIVVVVLVLLVIGEYKLP